MARESVPPVMAGKLPPGIHHGSVCFHTGLVTLGFPVALGSCTWAVPAQWCEGETSRRNGDHALWPFAEAVGCWPEGSEGISCAGLICWSLVILKIHSQNTEFFVVHNLGRKKM
jgi:hypothetical protein